MDVVRIAMVDLSKPSAYAGIGSRDTPPDVLALMTRIARKLDVMGWTDRGGGAEGADEAFDHSVSHAEIFQPWPKFAERGNRKHPLPVGTMVYLYDHPSTRAYEIAKGFHPKWNDISQGKQKLHARNVHQVLGSDCASPSAFVLCWTPDGSTGKTTAKTGGTGQAIRIAHAYGVPIFNLKRDDHRAEWERFVNEA